MFSPRFYIIFSQKSILNLILAVYNTNSAEIITVISQNLSHKMILADIHINMLHRRESMV